MTSRCFAQLCTGSLGDPVVQIDFGSGTATHAAALGTAVTSYTYVTANFPEDGQYTVENTTVGASNAWWGTTDHTSQAGGATGGYMMVVNASISKTDYFYQNTVTGLCSGTTYEFAAWVVNLLRSQDKSPPDITFSIYKPDGVTLIQSYDTGTIPLTPSGPTWKQYGFYFTMPTDVSSVVIKMTNNSNGGAPANDLALDDITFRACGPTIISSFNSSSSVTALSGCPDGSQSITLSATESSGYNNPVYQWQVNTGSGWTDIAGATHTSYTLQQPTTAGTYQYRMVSSEAANAGSAACQVASNVLTFTVSSPPAAAFSKVSTPCLSDPVTFSDNSTVASGTITSWYWDFGDGNHSTLQNPTCTYTTAGTYNVTLKVTSSNNCSSTSAAQVIAKDARPVAGFTTSTTNCAGQAVTFTDISTPTGTIKTWAWDLGDGTMPTYQTNAPFSHIYATASTYNVTLTVTSISGCVSLVTTHQVVVNPLPTVAFTLPDACLTDAATFTNQSTVTDGSTLSYAWDFGDQNASAADNTSALQNPSHKYSQTGNYTVTLTVTTSNGCVNSASQQFTVNGTVPVAKFSVENAGNLCSSDAVIIDNMSTVDFGNITKIVLYYDYDNAPGQYDTFLRSDGTIPSDGKFSHSYGTFNSPLTKNYHIKMMAYSGESCVSTTDQTITVNANPVASITAIGPLCQDDSPVQITADNNGFNGTGTFSGTGVSSSGLFSPSSSGAGTFTVSYTFTATNGCGYTTSENVVVNANPVVTAPSTMSILQGGQAVIKATATGDGLTYKWTPSTGLDHDDVLQPTASPGSDTQYTLTVTSSAGCSSTAIVSVSVLMAPVIPNTFTPNNDGVNDTWNIKYLDSYPDCTVEVFNRYGARVFYSVGYPTAWDGRINGQNLPVGTYYYIIDPKIRPKYSGWLLIMR